MRAVGDAARWPSGCLAQPALNKTSGQLSGTEAPFSHTSESDEGLTQQLHRKSDSWGTRPTCAT